MLRILIQNRREIERLGDLEMDGNLHCYVRRATLASHLSKNCSKNTHCVLILNSSYKTELYSSGFYNAVF
jgi:hypothetical protein